MKPSPRRLLVPALLLAGMVIVFLNAWWALRSVAALAHNQAWVEHTWQVINQVERIMGSATDAETGQRGFLISGDETYLEPYMASRSELPRELDHLQHLTADNPSQHPRVREMRQVLDARLSLLQHGIEQRRALGDDMQALPLSSFGRDQMNHLRAIADATEEEERRLLVIRTSTAAQSRQRAEYSVVLASGLDFLLLLFTFRHLLRERALRIAAESASERLAVASAEADARSEEVRLLNATLEERVRSRTAELERINRELEAFSYSVSHDLRAPLRTIDGFSLALQEDYAIAVDETGRDYIRRVRGAVQRMGGLIDALLQLSRITRAEIVREDVSMSQLVQSVAADLQEHTQGDPAVFHIEEGLAAYADPHLLRVAFENLLGNAVKFSSKVQQPEIHFGWDAAKSAWFVRDNGAGFDMTYASKLFNAFNRLHGDKDFKGSGIGLATVARVIHRHHGTIWAESAVNAGATFWFTLN